MKSFLTLFLCLFISFQAFSQPLERYGCHMRHVQANASVDTEQENRLWAASVERSDSFDILDYDLTIDLREMNNRLLYGKAIVTFTPKIAGLNFLPLDLLRLQVDSVLFEGQSTTFDYNKILLTVNTPTVLNIGQTYKVTVFYWGTPQTSSSGFGGFYFEDGIAYNLGIGLTDDPHNYGRSWFPCFDNFVERSTYTYRIITKNEITSFSVGDLVDDVPYNADSRIRTFRMTQIIPTYLSAIAASTYVSHDYTYNSIYGDIPVKLISKPADQPRVINSFSTVGDAVDALQSWYGKYPFERVGYVMTTRGAMEHPNCIAYPISVTGGNLDSRRLMSHELCHLWWGDLLTLKTQADMWIKEGNAEYGSHLFEEYLRGREAFESIVNENRYDVINNAHINDGRYLPLSPIPKDITYGTTTYKKGAMVMHSLRGYLGDDLFRSAQQKVLKDYAYSNLTAYTYRDALSAASGVDLTDFFDRWVFDIGFYDFVISDFHALDFSNHTHEITIKQKLLKSNGFCKNTPVVITFVHPDNSLSNQRVICTGELTKIPLDLDFQPKAVFLNYPLTLNLAQFSSLRKVTKKGNIPFSYANLSVSASEIRDSTWAYMENHYTAPDPSQSQGIVMNNKHFWKLTVADPDNIDLTGKIEYNFNWDDDLLQVSEDSIQLMYRPDGTSDWSVYPYYTKKAGSLADKKGSFLISKFLPGEYSTGNIDPNTVSTKSIVMVESKIYPNPIKGQFTLDLNQLKNDHIEDFRVTIIDNQGKIVFEQSINEKSTQIKLSENILPGIYQAILTNRNHQLLSKDKLIIF